MSGNELDGYDERQKAGVNRAPWTPPAVPTPPAVILTPETDPTGRSAGGLSVKTRAVGAAVAKLTSIVDSGVNPRLKITIQKLDGVQRPTADQIQLIAKIVGFNAPKELRDKIDGIEFRFEAARKLVLDHIPQKASSAFYEHTTAQQSETVETLSVDHIVDKSIEDFREDFRLKKNAAARLFPILMREAFENVKPYIGTFKGMVFAHADSIAQSEIEQCAKYGVPWEPSYLVMHLYKAADYLDKLIGPLGNSPKDMALFLFRPGN